MIKHRYNNKDYNSQYVTYSGGDFIYSSFDEFPVMLIAENICGLRTMAGPMPICNRHRFSAPCRGFAKTNVLYGKTFVLADLQIFREVAECFGYFR